MIRQGKILEQVQGPSRKPITNSRRWDYAKATCSPGFKVHPGFEVADRSCPGLIGKAAQNTWPVSAEMRLFWANRDFYCPQNPGSSTEQNEYRNKEGGQGIKYYLGK